MVLGHCSSERVQDLGIGSAIGLLHAPPQGVITLTVAAQSDQRALGVPGVGVGAVIGRQVAVGVVGCVVDITHRCWDVLIPTDSQNVPFPVPTPYLYLD